MNAVDTNVYVYALDADEPVKRAKAVELLDRLMLQRADTVLIWQAQRQIACRPADAELPAPLDPRLLSRYVYEALLWRISWVLFI